MTQRSRAESAVNAIAANGDMADHYKKSSTKFKTAYGSITSISAAAVTPFLLFPENTHTHSPTVVFAGSVGLVTANSLRMARRQKKLNTEQMSRQSAVREYLQEQRVDTVKDDKGRIVLDWYKPLYSYNPDSGESTSDARLIRDLASRAEELGASHALLNATGTVVDALPDAVVQSQAEWYDDHKKKVDLQYQYRSRPIVEASIQDMLQVARHIERQHSAESMQHFVELLRIGGLSKVPELYEAFVAGEATLSEVTKRIEYELCLQDGDTTAERYFDRINGSQHLTKQSTFTTRRGAGIQRITVSHDGARPAGVEHQSLLSIAHVQSHDQLHELLAMTDTTDPLTEQRARVALLLELRHTSEDPVSSDGSDDETFATLFDRLHTRQEELPMSKRARLKIFMGFTALTFATTVGIWGAFAQEIKLSDKRDIYLEQYDKTSPVYKKDHDFQAYLDDINTLESTGVQLSDAKQRFANRLGDVVNEIWPEKVNESERLPFEGKGTGTAPNGNIGDAGMSSQTGKIAAYTVTPLNGANTDGYWQMSTLEEMQFASEEAEAVSHNGLNQVVQPKPGIILDSITMFKNDAVNLTYPMEPKLINQKTAPMIKVESQSGPYVEGDMTTFRGGTPIAVKAGTVPIAARYEYTENNQTKFIPANLATNDQNEWYVLDARASKKPLDPNTDLKLTYWLSADTSVPLRAGQANIVTTQTLDGVKWETRLLEKGKQTSEVLGVDAFSAIKKKTYSVNPLSDSGIDKEKLDKSRSLDEYTAQLAKLSLANCNVSAIEYLVATGGEDKDGKLINAASGYYNNGDDKLTLNEAHMWVVDENGRIIDPTPSLSAVNSEGVKGEKFPVPITDIMKYAGVLGIGGLGALTLYRRRHVPAKVAKKVHGKASELAHKRLNKNPTVRDGKVMGKLNHALYAAPGSESQPVTVAAEKVEQQLYGAFPDVDYRQARESIGELSPREKLSLLKLTLAKGYANAITQEAQ